MSLNSFKTALNQMNDAGWRVINLCQIGDGWLCRLQWFTPEGASSSIFAQAHCEDADEAMIEAYANAQTMNVAKLLSTKSLILLHGAKVSRRLNTAPRRSTEEADNGTGEENGDDDYL